MMLLQLEARNMSEGNLKWQTEIHLPTYFNIKWNS